MSPALALLCLAAVALVAWGASAVIALARPALDAVLRPVGARGRRRVWGAAALLPGALALTTVATTLSPTSGLVTDHCLAHDPHHPHLCLAHGGAMPSALVIGLAVLLALRLGWAGARAAAAAWRSMATARALERACVERRDGVRVLSRAPSPALVVGLLRPRVYVTEALLAEDDAEAVIAHERVHARERHGLRRWLLSLALAFHLPGVARRLADRLSLSDEMAADDAAGHALGDRARVAEALLRWTRRAQTAPAGALAFGAGVLEARVHALLSDGPRREAPSGRTLAIVTLCALAALLAGADPIHHALETLLGLLSG